MPAHVSNFSFWFAMILALGSLLFYITSALWFRTFSKEIADRTEDFNLGIPTSSNNNDTFSISLIAAGTSLSTVFVFFLTAGSMFGWWMILSPIMFAVGNAIMFKVYNRINAKGYFVENCRNIRGVTGLIPYLGKAVSGNNSVGWIVLVLSVFNLLSVLTLELIVGVEVFGYLSSNTFGTSSSSIGEFLVFLFSIMLLLGYVYVGGFRAVVASDIWQMKAIKWAIFITIISLVIFVFNMNDKEVSLSLLNRTPPNIVLIGFILNVILANCFAPMSQEASWQRFRAFSNSKGIALDKAMLLAISQSLLLWIGLIVLSFSLSLAIPPGSGVELTSMSNALEVLRTLNSWWFPLFVFPVMTVAALSAMYSTADTSVSALLYLIEYFRYTHNKHTNEIQNERIKSSYLLSMMLIFLVCIGSYFFVRIWFNPTILQLVFSVFSNLVVIAPTVLTAAIFAPASPNMEQSQKRTPFIITSLALGFVAYWSSTVMALILGGEYLWLSQLSIVIGLAGAIIPVMPLWISSNKKINYKVQ